MNLGALALLLPLIAGAEVANSEKVPIIACPERVPWVPVPPNKSIIATEHGNRCYYDQESGSPDIVLVTDKFDPSQGRPGQLRKLYNNPKLMVVLTSLENLFRFDANYGSSYDLFYSYRGMSPVRRPAAIMPTVEEYVTLPDHVPQHNRIHCCISNCEPYRVHMIEKMCQADFPIDIYGGCNPKIAQTNCRRIHTRDRMDPGWEERKKAVLKTYRFALAMENSRDQFYVTEKLYHPLMTNTIPIYWGDDKINEHDLAPHPLSHLDYNDFDYIRKVMESDELQYLHRRSWRTAEEINKHYIYVPSNTDYFYHMCDYYHNVFSRGTN